MAKSNNVVPGSPIAQFEYKPLGLENFAAPLGQMAERFNLAEQAVDEADFNISGLSPDNPRATELLQEFNDYKSQLADELNKTSDYRGAAKKLRQLNKIWKEDPEIQLIQNNKAQFLADREVMRKKVEDGLLSEDRFKKWETRILGEYAEQKGLSYDRTTGSHGFFNSSPRVDDLEQDIQDKALELSKAGPEQQETILSGWNFLDTDTREQLKTVLKYVDKGQIEGEVAAILMQSDRYKTSMAANATDEHYWQKSNWDEKTTGMSFNDNIFNNLTHRLKAEKEGLKNQLANPDLKNREAVENNIKEIEEKERDLAMQINSAKGQGPDAVNELGKDMFTATYVSDKLFGNASSAADMIDYANVGITSQTLKKGGSEGDGGNSTTTTKDVSDATITVQTSTHTKGSGRQQELVRPGSIAGTTYQEDQAGSPEGTDDELAVATPEQAEAYTYVTKHKDDATFEQVDKKMTAYENGFLDLSEQVGQYFSNPVVLSKYSLGDTDELIKDVNNAMTQNFPLNFIDNVDRYVNSGNATDDDIATFETLKSAIAAGDMTPGEAMRKLKTEKPDLYNSSTNLQVSKERIDNMKAAVTNSKEINNLNTLYNSYDEKITEIDSEIATKREELKDPNINPETAARLNSEIWNLSKQARNKKVDQTNAFNAMEAIIRNAHSENRIDDEIITILDTPGKGLKGALEYMQNRSQLELNAMDAYAAHSGELTSFSADQTRKVESMIERPYGESIMNNFKWIYSKEFSVDKLNIVVDDTSDSWSGGVLQDLNYYAKNTAPEAAGGPKVITNYNSVNNTITYAEPNSNKYNIGLYNDNPSLTSIINDDGTEVAVLAYNRSGQNNKVEIIEQIKKEKGLTAQGAWKDYLTNNGTTKNDEIQKWETANPKTLTLGINATNYTGKLKDNFDRSFREKSTKAIDNLINATLAGDDYSKNNAEELLNASVGSIAAMQLVSNPNLRRDYKEVEAKMKRAKERGSTNIQHLSSPAMWRPVGNGSYEGFEVNYVINAEKGNSLEARISKVTYNPDTKEESKFKIKTETISGNVGQTMRQLEFYYGAGPEEGLMSHGEQGDLYVPIWRITDRTKEVLNQQ